MQLTQDLPPFNLEQFITSESFLDTKAKIHKKEHVTIKQKEIILNFVEENPEMVTHSSTRENEEELWKVLGANLNNLKPAKELDKWRNFFKRWTSSVTSKPAAALVKMDERLKNFLNRVLTNPESSDTTNCICHTASMQQVHNKGKKKFTIEEINNFIADLDKERYNLNLELDSNDIKILKYKNAIKNLEHENSLKRKRLRNINEKKVYLNKKKIKYEEQKRKATSS